jgi:hypothetical protein
MRNYYQTSIGTKGDVRGCPSFVIDVAWVLAAVPGAPVTLPDTDVSEPNNTFTKVAHGFKTGMSAVITTDGLAVPAPLVSGTAYFIIWVDNDTFKLALTRADAVAPTAVPIDLTDTGSAAATITFTPEANVATCEVERAINPSNSTSALSWTTISSINLVTASSPQTVAKVDNPYSWVRARFVVVSGAFTGTPTAILGGTAWAK